MRHSMLNDNCRTIGFPHCSTTPAMLRALALSAVLLTSSAQALEERGFDRCIAQLGGEAAAKGVGAATFERHTAGLAPDMEVIALLDHQPEFRTPIWDYMAALVDDERISDGKAMLEQWRETLERIETAYGVDAATIVAVWGVESNFGRNFGTRPLIRSLASLSCFGRRQDFFRGEFFTTLKIIEQGHVDADSLVGSWAGAFGHTQFMPSTFMRVAVDFDGDGRRDLVGSIPDALASTANYLKGSGWRTGQGWGHEVRLPRGLDPTLAGRRNKRPISEWSTLGVTRTDGSALAPSDVPAGLLLPAGAEGPAFLVLRNFDALYSYNAAESYALAIAHLSDRLRGGGPFASAWPTDDPGISRAERRELQSLLIARGHDIGAADGIIGANTRRAIAALQSQWGLPADGRAGRRLLEALRRAP